MRDLGIELKVSDGALDRAVELYYRRAVRKQVEGLLELIGIDYYGALTYSELLSLVKQLADVEIERIKRIGPLPQETNTLVRDCVPPEGDERP